MTENKSTAIANANIALIKYWGKRNKELILPFNSSISMTCDGLQTKTTVEFSDKYEEHTVIINDEEFKKDEKDIHGHLDRIKKLANFNGYAKVISETNFPVAAGLASSASGFSALTLAATKALGLNLTERELTILTRQGSGSACRSFCEGFAIWHKGFNEDGKDSYAETIEKKDYWPEFRMITTIVQESKKKVSSRGGMAQTVSNCPYYEGWLKTIDEDLEQMKKGIKEKNFTLVGSTAEKNALKMHATMITTTPSIIYWTPATMEILHSVMSWREEGLECYFTMDAGPNVKVICLQKDEEEINKKLLVLEGVKKTIVCKPGDKAKLSDEHLF